MPRDILESLNVEQRRAVTRARGPVCILAGAGSGKTTTITHRIACQVQTGVFAPSQILAVTFTEKAAREMKTRLARLGIEGVRASTFHSAAFAQLRVLSGAPLKEVLPSKAASLRRIANTLPRPYRFRPAMDLATEIEWARNRRVTHDDYLDHLGDHEPPIPADLMASVWRRFEKSKHDADVVDFEDLLELAIRMYESDEVALTRFRAKYEALTVDEYQDVNLLQETLLRLWMGERRDLCVVGDDYQSIYGFTGATPEYLLDMPRRFPATEVIRLEHNYRSTPEILDIANRLVPRLGGADKVLRTTRPSGTSVTARSFPADSAELAFVVSRIGELHDDGVAYEEMAVLYRVNFRSEDYEGALAGAGIPYQVRDTAFLFRAAARFVLKGLRARTRSTTVAADVKTLAGRAGYVDERAEDLGEQETTRQDDLARLIRLAEEFDDDARTSEQFVADLQARFSTEGDGRGVNLLTYHRAKGLEFDAVFLPRLEDGELPFKRARSTEAYAEERRLLYVGITRAKDHLAVTWVSGGGRRKPSPFVYELRLGAAARAEGLRRAPLAPPARRTEIAAAVGLRVELPGEFGGEITELRDDSATVRLDEGGEIDVSYGDRVMSGGVGGVLRVRVDAHDREGTLKAWRLDRSKLDSVPAFVILHDSTLTTIAEQNPHDLEELSRIPGIGPAKLEQYGAEILDALSAASE